MAASMGNSMGKCYIFRHSACIRRIVHNSRHSSCCYRNKNNCFGARFMSTKETPSSTNYCIQFVKTRKGVVLTGSDQNTCAPKMAASMGKCYIFRHSACIRRIVHNSRHSSCCYRNKNNCFGARFMSTKETPSSTNYCIQFVKKCDYENYLVTLLYPKEYRLAAFALRALYIELAQVQDVTTDNMRAIMRLQFWKDTIDQVFKGKPPQTPVALLLAEALEKHKLSKLWVTRILEAREKQINTKVVRSLKEVEDLAENTVSALNYLLLEAAGIKNVHADHAASHIGQCQGLVTALRGTPFHASKNNVYIPLELLIKHNASQEQILRGKDDQVVKDVMYDIASRAHQHLETARSMKKDVPSQAMPLFINTMIFEQYLKNLQLVDFNVFDKNLFVRNPKLPWNLWKQRYLKRTF